MTRTMISCRWAKGLLLALVACLVVGCQNPPKDNVFYCGGAGGGTILNWGKGLKTGLTKAGYQGKFTSFKWQSGLGALADQQMSVKSKRSKAKRLAAQIRKHIDENPDQHVYIIGLSAGTSVAVFALEELPAYAKVESVVLLGSSMSSTYDLGRALPAIEGKLFAFGSEKDSTLKFWVPVTGTSDRQYKGRSVAGVKGFHPPKDASGRTKASYEKTLVNVEWDESRKEAGDRGGHLSTTNSRFIERYVVPLVLEEQQQRRGTAARGAAGN